MEKKKPGRPPKYPLKPKAIKQAVGTLDRVYDNPPEYTGTSPEEPTGENYETKLYLESRTQEIDRALVMACKEGNAQALKIAYQLQGKIKEDEKAQKVKVSLNGTDLARELLKARRELDKARVVEVLNQPGVLHNPIRQIAGQGEHSNDKVHDVGLPERPA